MAVSTTRSHAACEKASVDFAGMQNATRHRHTCYTLRRVCLFNGTLLPQGQDSDDASHMLHVASAFVVRSQFGSHRSFPFAHLHPMHQPPQDSPVKTLLARERLSTCVPLIWVPVWAFSFADSFVSSLLPLDELQSAGLIDEHVLLRPDLWAWPRSKNRIYRMLGTLSSQPIRSVRESAPACHEKLARRKVDRNATHPCMPHCYKRILLCNFKSSFDAYVPPMAPWRASQRISVSVLHGRPAHATTAAGTGPLSVRPGEAAQGSRCGRCRSSPAAEPARRLLRVVFVNRTRTRFRRSLSNVLQLLQRCRSVHERWADGWRVVCRAHAFGHGSLADDVNAARGADVVCVVARLNPRAHAASRLMRPRREVLYPVPMRGSLSAFMEPDW